MGKCPGCQSWNSMVEEFEESSTSKKRSFVTSGNTLASKPQSISKVVGTDEQRFTTNINELDRVLGGGVVPGSLVLVGGDPGIGKSTLLLQCAGGLATPQSSVLYVTAEDLEQQVKLRAERVGIRADNLYLFSEAEIGVVIA